MLVKFFFLFGAILQSTSSIGGELTTYTLSFNNGVVSPQTLAVPANTKFQLRVDNIGSTAEEFESLELNREKIIPPGKSVTIFLGPLKKNTYAFFGEFHADMKSSHGKIIAE